MFWRERGWGSGSSSSTSSTDQNGGPPCGQVRVLVVGDSGVGKTSLVHLIIHGSSILQPAQTIGCSVGVKHISYGSSSDSVKAPTNRDFFVELWDVSGHERYKGCRSLFYSQINGVIFVHDLSQRRTKTGLQKWAAEVAENGTFSAPLGSPGPFGLPVPYIVICNKVDVANEEGARGSSGDLIDVARQWVEKQGFLPSSEELPLAESFPGSGGVITAAKEAQFDKEAVMKFFRMLIRRRYFPDDLNAPSPFSVRPVRGSGYRLNDNLSEDDISPLNRSYERNMLPPLPAQRNLTPPPTLNPQLPVSIPDNRGLPRYPSSGSLEMSRSRSRTDINV